MVSKNQFKNYCSFVGLAITGFPKEADAMMRDENLRNDIMAVSRKLSVDLKNSGFVIPCLYRGIIVEKGSLEPGGMTRNLGQPFLSFSDDIDVACYFSSGKSSLSKQVVENIKNPVGYIASYKPKFNDIIFCYHYMKFISNIIIKNKLSNTANSFFNNVFLETFPLNQHPSSFNHFAWNLQTQREFIIKNKNSEFKYRPFNKFNCKPQKILDEKIDHPLRDR